MAVVQSDNENQEQTMVNNVVKDETKSVKAPEKLHKKNPRESFSQNALGGIVKFNTHFTQVEKPVYGLLREFYRYLIETIQIEVLAQLINEGQSTMTLRHFKNAFDISNILGFNTCINPIHAQFRIETKDGKKVRVKKSSKIVKHRLEYSLLPLQSVRNEITKVSYRLLDEHFNNNTPGDLRTSRDYTACVIFYLEDILHIVVQQTFNNHPEKKKLLRK